MGKVYATPRDRASAALAEFRRRVPMMTGFAKSFSGNLGVQIKPTSQGPHTDGSTIHLEVPLKMADIGNHGDRSRCGEWDSVGMQMCKDCAIVDDLNYTLFHEISHIWGGSFEAPTNRGRLAAIRVVKNHMATRVSGDYEFVINDPSNDTWLKISYMLHPFLKELVNCFEDARVNERMARVRPGVRKWRRAFERRLMEDGIRRFDPRENKEVVFRPSDAPLNAQMAYSMYFLACGEPVPRDMDKYVLKCLTDPRVTDLMKEATGNLDADKTFEFSVRAYALMADMGFFGNEPQQQDDPEQDDEDNDDLNSGVAPLNAEDDDESEGDEGDGEGGEGSSPPEDEDSDVESYSGSEDDSGDGDGDGPDEDAESSDAGPSGSVPDDDDQEEPGSGPTEGSGAEPQDDGESSDGDASDSSEDEDSGDGEAAPDSEDESGAGGESSSDELDDEPSDESSDGSNPGETGEGSPEGSEGEESEGDASPASDGADSLEEDGSQGASEGDDTGGSGEVQDAAGDADEEGDEDPGGAGSGDAGSDADEAPGAEGDGPGEGGEQGEGAEDHASDPYGGDDASDESLGDHEGRDGDAQGDDDGDSESGGSSEADDAEGGDEAHESEAPGDEGGHSPHEDEHGTGEAGDSTDGKPSDREDGSDGGDDDSSTESHDDEAADGDEVGGGESFDRADAGVDEDFDGDPTGESDGNEGAHGKSGPMSGDVGEDDSELSADGSGDSPNVMEEAGDAPEELEDDTPPVDREWGDAKETHDRLEDLFGHHSPNEEEKREVIEELERIISIGDVFDEIPRNVSQVWWNKWQRHYVHPEFGDQATAWTHNISSQYWFHGWPDEKIGIAGDFRVPDSIIGKALLRARIAFADNARKREVRHLKAGRVNARSLGKRAPIHDPRLFKKIARPGKRDYFVVIGLDLSASTTYAPPKEWGEPELPSNLSLIKRSAMAQCEVLSRLGVKFAVYGHSAKNADLYSGQVAVNMYVVKDAGDPWNEQTRRRLETLGPDEGNLDGHTLQLYRKIAEKQPTTDHIIMYYTDGEIPALNGQEEGEVLLHEIEACRKKDITLMGVGIRTDSLAKFEFDYVRVDQDEDLVKVVNNLEKRLAGN